MLATIGKYFGDVGIQALSIESAVTADWFQ